MQENLKSLEQRYYEKLSRQNKQKQQRPATLSKTMTFGEELPQASKLELAGDQTGKKKRNKKGKGKKVKTMEEERSLLERLADVRTWIN